MYEYNKEGLEIEVQGTSVTWTEDDDVYLYRPNEADREDGYTCIGQLEWVNSEGDSHDGNMQYNIERLREFVLEVLK